MKRKLLSYLLVLTLLFCSLPVKIGSAADYKYAVEGEDYVLNVSSKFNAPHYINGYCFSDMSYYERYGQTWMICTVTNVSDVARDITFPDIHIYDDTGIQITGLGGIIDPLEPGQSVQLNASATFTGIIDAYDYTMTFSPEDTLNPNEEITIKKGIICTSHEIKENDTVTLICEESDEGVEYQWFWSINKNGGGNMIQGANDRRLTLSNVSLEQFGRYYYCQINKKGKIEYTDRFGLMITSVTTPKPITGSMSKNKSDVNALNAIIAEQKALGATISEDLDSDEYDWAADGRLIAIDWVGKNLQGNLSLQGLPQLVAVICNKNQLTGLDVSKNTILRSLWCSLNQLTSLDISNSILLTNLNCSANQLTSLNLSSNTALTSLGCNDNHLTSLDISNNIALIELQCVMNNLTSLDVSNNIALTSLWCDRNSLTSLDVSNNVALTSLNCTANRLTSLDVSSNTALTELRCSICPLASLDVSNNTRLTVLECTNNLLTSLDVSKCTALTTLTCDEDVVVTGRSDSVTPDMTASPSPEAGPSASPPQEQILLKVKKIKVQQTTDLKAKLTWEKITSDKIVVLRAEKRSGAYRIIKQFSGSQTSYTDKTAKRGKTYYYKVVAHNGDLQVQLNQIDLTVKKITIGYLIPPVITIKKGTSGGQKYVQVFLQKYEGQYADIYMKSSGDFQKLVMKKRTIQSYRKRYRFRYRKGGVTLYFRARTYKIVKGRKRVSPYSKTVKIKI